LKPEASYEAAAAPKESQAAAYDRVQESGSVVLSHDFRFLTFRTDRKGENRWRAPL
jgi:hypothetical protein